MQLHFSLPGILSAMLLAAGAACQAEDELSASTQMELDYVRSLAEDLRTKARAPLKELDDKYLAAVGNLRDKAATTSNVAARLEAEAALDEFKRSGTPDGESGHAGVARLETIYLEQKPKVEEQIRPALVKAEQAYGQELKRMVGELTKQGQISQALLLKKEMDGLAERLRSMQQGDGPVAAKARTVPKVVILKATYASGEHKADVTRKVAGYVASGRAFSANPTDLGVDPRPHHNKRLQISYEKDGIKRQQDRSENETVLVESFTGPQDVKEMMEWLIGSCWQSDTRELFFKDTTEVKNKDTSGTWEPDGMYKIIIAWGAGTRRRYQFDWKWTELKETGGMEETFVPRP